MMFLAEWVPGGANASLEERSTLCDLRIIVGGENACLHWDRREEGKVDWVTVPAVHLAEGLATDWWAIFGGRDVRHAIWRYRNGSILPCLSLSCDGSFLEVAGEQMVCENPGLLFWLVGSETVPREVAEVELSSFVDSVVDKLVADGIRGSEVQLCWGRVLESRREPGEAAFCEAAGALGVDPYSVGGWDASFIESAGSLLYGNALCDFLAGVRRLDSRRRSMVMRSMEWVRARSDDSSVIPGLGDAAMESGSVSGEWRPGERAWAPGYRSARKFRRAIGLGEGDIVRSVADMATRLGARGFGYCEDLYGVSALVCRDEDVRVHLRGKPDQVDWLGNFSFARAIGDVVCFPDGGSSVVNRLRGAERQAAGRAFAAEFLAPVDRVMGMVEEDWDVDEIAGEFRVSPQVIERQIENRGLIEAACA